MKDVGDLGSEKLSRLIFRMSVPAILGMTVNLFYNIVDRIFVGELASEALSAITMVSPYMTILSGFAVLVGTGAAALISIKLGEKKPRMANCILSTSLVLLFMLSVLIMLPSFFLQEQILKLSGSTETSELTLRYAKDYLFVIILGVPFQLISLGMDQSLRAEGNAKVAMYAMILGAVTNIVLDPIFIFVFSLGTRGAAIATVIGQALSGAFILSRYFMRRSHLTLSLRFCRLRYSAKIMTLGMPQFLIQLASSVIMLIYNNSLVRYGKILDPVRGADVALAAFGIITSVSMVLIMPLNGLSQGIQPIVGYNYGAKFYMRVKKTFLTAILYATVWMTVGFLAAELVPHYIIMVFNRKDAELIRFGAQTLRIVALFLPLVGFQTLSSNYFLAVGKPGASIFLSVSRQVVLFIPLLLVLPLLLPVQLKIYGVIWASPVADVLSAAIAGVYIFFEMKRLNRLERKKEVKIRETEETKC